MSTDELSIGEVCQLLLVEQPLSSRVRLARALRNHCTGSPAAQAMIHYEVVPAILQIIKDVSISRTLGGAVEAVSSDEEEQTRTLVLLLAQTLANFSACGEAARAYLFALQSGLEWLEHLFSCASQQANRNTLAASLALLHNCLVESQDENGQSERQDGQARRQKLCSSRGLLCQVLLSLLTSSGGESLSEGVKGDNSPFTGEAVDPAREWFYLLAFLWVRTGLVCSIYRAVSSAELKGPTHEQLVLLQLVLEALQDPHCVEVLGDQHDQNLQYEKEEPAHMALLVFSTASAGSGGVVDLTLLLVDEVCAAKTIKQTRATSTEAEASATAEAGAKAAVNETDYNENATEAVLEVIEQRMRGEIRDAWLPLAIQVIAAFLAAVPRQPPASPAPQSPHLREIIACDTALVTVCAGLLFGRDITSRKAAQRTSSTGGAGGAGGVRSSADTGGSGGASKAGGSFEEDRMVCVRSCLQVLGNLVHGCERAQVGITTSPSFSILPLLSFAPFSDPH
ncbi:hypothetical protein B484DRAFT_97027, partial [Ochromonadaceae sp. CCMP2298]